MLSGPLTASYCLRAPLNQREEWAEKGTSGHEKVTFEQPGRATCYCYAFKQKIFTFIEFGAIVFTCQIVGQNVAGEQVWCSKITLNTSVYM